MPLTLGLFIADYQIRVIRSRDMYDVSKLYFTDTVAANM